MPGYPPQSSHYSPHPGPYYSSDAGPPAGANSSSSGYRKRYPSGSSSDWAGRDREFDYRRSEYDRRAPPPSGAS